VDDLLSVFYSLLEMLIGRLPWRGKRDLDEVAKLKRDAAEKKFEDPDKKRPSVSFGSWREEAAGDRRRR